MTEMKIEWRSCSVGKPGWTEWKSAALRPTSEVARLFRRPLDSVCIAYPHLSVEYRLPKPPKPPTPAEALKALGLDPQGRPNKVDAWLTRFQEQCKAFGQSTSELEREVTATERSLASRVVAAQTARRDRLAEAERRHEERIREALAVLDRVEALELPPKKLNHASPYSHGYHDGQRSLYRQITSNERDRA